LICNQEERGKIIIFANKRGTGPIGAILLFLFFIIIWFVWLGGFVAQVGQDMVVSNNLSGAEAFFIANLNVWIMISIILGTMAYMYFGQQQ
jgi:hypothetical protein